MSKKTLNRLNREFNSGLVERNKKAKEEFKVRIPREYDTLAFKFDEETKKTRIVKEHVITEVDEIFVKDAKRAVFKYNTLSRNILKSKDYFDVLEAELNGDFEEKIKTVKNKGKIKRLNKVRKEVQRKIELEIKLKGGAA